MSSLFDRLDFGVDMDRDSHALEFLHQPADEVGIESGQHTGAVLEDNDVGARTRGDVRKLRSNVSATHEHDARRRSAALARGRL